MKKPLSLSDDRGFFVELKSLSPASWLLQVPRPLTILRATTLACRISVLRAAFRRSAAQQRPFSELRLQVILQPDGLDQPQLLLQPVGVIFLGISQLHTQDLAGDVILVQLAELDALAQRARTLFSKRRSAANMSGTLLPMSRSSGRMRACPRASGSGASTHRHVAPLLPSRD